VTTNIIELPYPFDTALIVPIATGWPCQQQGPDLWFSTSPADLNLAKAYCRGCHNRQPCLAGALERAEPAGVWGGEIFENGRVIARKRPRGRPRKQPAPALQDEAC
jgi:WhiB family redox-sensing transcriptional regulator